MSSSLLERMSQLREKTRAENPCPRSEASNPSPLSLYLAIYTKATYDCYINYNEGSKALLNWLAPPGIPLDFEVAVYPQIEDTNFIIPRLLRGYESGELSKLLAPESRYPQIEARLAALAKAERAIYLTTKDLI